MAWPVYSERFVFAYEPGTYFRYTVPGGRRAIIMTATAQNTDDVEIRFFLLVAFGVVWSRDIQGRDGAVATNLRLAVYPGEPMECVFVGGAGSMMVSGFLLTQPAASRAAPAMDIEPLDDVDFGRRRELAAQRPGHGEGITRDSTP